MGICGDGSRVKKQAGTRERVSAFDSLGVVNANQISSLFRSFYLTIMGTTLFEILSRVEKICRKRPVCSHSKD